VTGAVALPAAAGLLYWALLGLVGLLDRRVSGRIKSLEDTKRAMIKELKVALAAGGGRGMGLRRASGVGGAEQEEWGPARRCRTPQPALPAAFNAAAAGPLARRPDSPTPRRAALGPSGRVELRAHQGAD
jgi:hypothetical protein